MLAHTRKGDFMNYKKYEKLAYNIHIIDTKKFKTNTVKVTFKKTIEEKDITYCNLLSKVLLESNKHYKNKQEIEIRAEDLYNLSINCATSLSGNYIIVSFSAVFLNEIFTEDGLNEKSLEFIFQSIFEPNLECDGFAYFDLAKRALKEEIDSINKNPRLYSQLKMLESIVSYKQHNPVGYLNELDVITNKDLYKYYLDFLKLCLIDVFFVGNVNEDVVKEQIIKYLEIKTVKKNHSSHFITHNEFRTKPIVLKEIMNIEQAKLSMGFKLKNLTEFEIKYVLNIYSYILGGSADSKLFKNIREKHSLCYTINCTHQPVMNLLMINAGIDQNDFKKCVSLIKKEISNMAKGEFSDTDIMSAKLTYINSLKDIEDFQGSLLRIFESYEYIGFDLLPDRKKNIEKVTREDIINLSKKIKLDTIFLLEGEL